MGISINVYSVYGVKTDWDSEFSELYDQVYDDPDTPNVIIDGMSGEYMIFGEILFNSGDARYAFEEGDSVTEFNIAELKKLEKKYKTNFKKKFPDCEILNDCEFKVISFLHYS
jgi:hypothetical protein